MGGWKVRDSFAFLWLLLLFAQRCLHCAGSGYESQKGKWKRKGAEKQNPRLCLGSEVGNSFPPRRAKW